MHAVRWLTRLKRNAKHAAADAHVSASRIDVSVLSSETHPFYDSAYYRFARWFLVRPALVALLIAETSFTTLVLFPSPAA